MIKILSVIILSVFLVSCNKDGSSNSTDCASLQAEESGSNTDCTINSEPEIGEATGGIGGGTEGGTSGGNTETGLPNAAYTFDSNIMFIGTTVTEQNKFERAVEIIKKVGGDRGVSFKGTQSYIQRS
jgi:hypothetical protein